VNLTKWIQDDRHHSWEVQDSVTGVFVVAIYHDNNEHCYWLRVRNRPDDVRFSSFANAQWYANAIIIALKRGYKT